MNSILIASNVLKRAFRKKRELLILTILPIVIVSIMTIVSNQSSINIIDVGYVNSDRGILGETLVDYIKGNDNFKMIQVREEESLDFLEKNKITLLLNIPENFTESIEQKQRTEVITTFEESDYSYVNLKQHINHYINRLYVISDLGLLDNIQNFTEILNNTGLTVNYRIAGSANDRSGYEAQLTSMGFVITFIMMLIFISMGNLLEDRKKLTLARIFSFPVKARDIVLGNILGSLIIGLMQLIPILFVLKILFRMSFDSSFIGFAATLVAFLVTSIGLGIGLAGIVKTNFNPLLLFATVIVPTSILGGAFIPSSMMPDIVSRIAYIVPQKWVMDSLEKMLSGDSINTIFFNLAIIILFGLAFSTFGIKTLKPIND